MIRYLLNSLMAFLKKLSIIIMRPRLLTSLKPCKYVI